MTIGASSLSEKGPLILDGPDRLSLSLRLLAHFLMNT